MITTTISDFRKDIKRYLDNVGKNGLIDHFRPIFLTIISCCLIDICIRIMISAPGGQCLRFFQIAALNNPKTVCKTENKPF
jgi:hypothetical protein